VSQTGTSAVGLFGKLPARGDFLLRSLPTGFTEPWHAWLVAGLGEARAGLGRKFEPAYMSAPVWRFVLPAGAAGEQPVTGVLLPSVDAAGRLFPVTLAHAAAGPLDALALLGSAGWFDELEACGRAGLEVEDGLDDWLATLDALPPPSAGTAPTSGWARAELADLDPLGTLLPRLAACAAASQALFWSAGSPHVRPAAWHGPGLPSPELVVHLLADVSAAEDAPA
jgi:type VI secretion system protein ImpM